MIYLGCTMAISWGAFNKLPLQLFVPTFPRNPSFSILEFEGGFLEFNQYILFLSRSTNTLHIIPCLKQTMPKFQRNYVCPPTFHIKTYGTLSLSQVCISSWVKVPFEGYRCEIRLNLKLEVRGLCESFLEVRWKC